MEAATKTLSERFARLQQYGLGVNTMAVRMNERIVKNILSINSLIDYVMLLE